MRLEDYFTKNIVAPYKKRKKILDLNKLEKVYKIDKKYLFLALFSIVVFLVSRRYSLFIVLTALSTVFTYYHAKVNRTPVDLKFALVFGLFITRYYGIVFTIIYFLISDLVPNILGGSSIDAASLVFMSWYFIVNALVYIFPSVSLTILGPILVVVEALGSVFINSFFGIPGFMSVIVSIVSVVIRIIYFLTIGRVLEILFAGG